MRRRTPTPLLLAALPLLAFPFTARAEGIADVGSSQNLDPDTDIYVDILDSSTETFTYTGTVGSTSVTASVYDPSGTLLGTYASGTNARLDRAIALHAPLMQLLRQHVDEPAPRDTSMQQLATLLRT